MTNYNKNIKLKIKNLKTYFFKKSKVGKAVDNISFSLKKEKVLAIVGESGCGKTVTAFSILNLIEPPGKIISGEIIFNNQNILKLKEKELRKIRGNKISMIFQDPMNSLNPVFTVGYQILETILTHKKITQKEAKKLAIEMFKKVQLENPEKIFDLYPHQLSGGMRQRVMIAIALSTSPEILIADEPTTALDVTIQKKIIELLFDLKEKEKLSIIFITHDFRIVKAIADDVIVMYGGKIVEQQDKENIFKKPLHPYTKGLLNSIVSLNKEEKYLPVIKGNVPDIYSYNKGCPFYERCEISEQKCLKSFPPEKIFNSTSRVFCWKFS